MKRVAMMAVLAAATWWAASAAQAGGGMEPIQSVEVGENGFVVNGKPFFPLMLWLQSDERIGDGLSIAVNTFAANGGKLSRADYLKKLGENGLYGVVHYEEGLEVGPWQLGWIQGDEPDMAEKKSDGEVIPAQGMKVNSSTPFARIVDGATNSWTVIDPLEGGSFTIKLAKPATVESVAVWPTISDGLPVAKDVVFEADGKEILKATLENKKGQQKFALPEPVTLTALTVKITSAYASDKQKWGSIGEVEAFDKDGKDVLLSKPYMAPRVSVAEILANYEKIKALDKTRPVLMTFTADFDPAHSKYSEEQRAQVYPPMAKGCDVVGFDYYPVYGSSMPGTMLRVAECVTELRKIAGAKRPVYAWIETNKGSKWMTLENQLDVTPRDTRAEVWMAIIRGATGIGYFTHRWRPDYKQFALEPEMVTEVKRLDEQIMNLASEILAPAAKRKVTMSMAGGLACHVKATEPAGELFIIAQNVDLGEGAEKLKQFQPIKPREGKATIAVEGLAAGTKVEVVDEGRTIEAGDGEFTDDFAPLAEHIYRIKM